MLSEKDSLFQIAAWQIFDRKKVLIPVCTFSVWTRFKPKLNQALPGPMGCGNNGFWSRTEGASGSVGFSLYFHPIEIPSDANLALLWEGRNGGRFYGLGFYAISSYL